MNEALSIALIAILGTGSFLGIASRDSHRADIQRKDSEIRELKARIEGLTVGCLGSNK